MEWVPHGFRVGSAWAQCGLVRACSLTGPPCGKEPAGKVCEKHTTEQKTQLEDPHRFQSPAMSEDPHRFQSPVMSPKRFLQGQSGTPTLKIQVRRCFRGLPPAHRHPVRLHFSLIRSAAVFGECFGGKAEKKLD